MAAIHSDEFKRDAVRIALTSGLTRPAVAAQAQPMLFADMGQDHHIGPLTDGRGPAQPRAQPAIRHARHAAEMAARKAALIAGDELKLHSF